MIDLDEIERRLFKGTETSFYMYVADDARALLAESRRLSARVAELEAKPSVPLQEWDSGRLSSIVPSNWSRSSTHTLWVEDDAPVPDKETYRQAWVRLFGEDIRSERPIAQEDFGDETSELYSRGRVLSCAFDGCRIEQLKFMPCEHEDGK